MEDIEIAKLRGIWDWYQIQHSSKYSGVGMFDTSLWCGFISHEHPYSVELVRTFLSTYFGGKKDLSQVLKSPSGHANLINYK